MVVVRKQLPSASAWRRLCVISACVIVGAAIAIGWSMSIVAASTQCARVGPPAPARGACCADDTCTLTSDAECGGLFHAGAPACNESVCASVPPQCACRGLIGGRASVAGFAPSTRYGACLDVTILVESFDYRNDSRCPPRVIQSGVSPGIVGVAPDITDDSVARDPIFLVGDVRCPGVNDVAFGNFLCDSTLVANTSTAYTFVISIFRPDVAGSTLRLNLAQSAGGDAALGNRCDDNFFRLEAFEFDLSAAAEFACAPPLGACCLGHTNRPDDVTCYEHMTNQTCGVTSLVAPYGFDEARFVPGATCSQDVCPGIARRVECFEVNFKPPVVVDFGFLPQACTNHFQSVALEVEPVRVALQQTLDLASVTSVVAGLCDPTTGLCAR